MMQKTERLKKAKEKINKKVISSIQKRTQLENVNRPLRYSDLGP